MARLLKRKAMRGFTLVELLIVVAIIGVLATIGVPTFQKMVQKSKQSEAKIALGALFTSEVAFNSEYGGFGSHLPTIGFELDGSPLLFSTGFPTATAAAVAPPASVGCANGAVANVVPSLGSAIGTQINQAFPKYYASTDATSITNNGTYQTVEGRALGGNCYSGSIADPGTSFTASSTGCVAPGCVPTSNATSGGGTSNTPVQDAWVMDNNRNLTNIVYGITN